ncbi:alpha-N-methyltransferase NTM1 [Aspergillus recurvatus]
MPPQTRFRTKPAPASADTTTTTTAAQPTTTECSQDTAPPDTKINHAASLDYWNSFAATPNTMLGVMGNQPWYTRIDLRGSKTFLAKARRLVPGANPGSKLGRGVDCGAGVGRVSEGFLRDVCEVVDAVEPVEKFADVIRQLKIKEEAQTQGAIQNGAEAARGVIGDIYVTGLESWTPTWKYDLIWTQFCANYVTDAQLVEFLRRCCKALTENGIVCLKENISTDFNGRDMYDEEDSSVTRTDEKFRALFKETGMSVIASEMQTGIPKNYNLLPVRFYALRPKS